MNVHMYLIFTGLTLLSSYWSGKLLHTSIHGFQSEENAAAIRGVYFWRMWRKSDWQRCLRCCWGCLNGRHCWLYFYSFCRGYRGLDRFCKRENWDGRSTLLLRCYSVDLPSSVPIPVLMWKARWWMCALLLSCLAVFCSGACGHHYRDCVRGASVFNRYGWSYGDPVPDHEYSGRSGLRVYT